MATNLPTDIAATYPDASPGDATHQAHHDEGHAYMNSHDTAPDPHGDRAYADSAAGSAVTTHEAAADPHPQYYRAEDGDTAWHNVGAADEPAFQNGWVNFDTAQYPGAKFRKDAHGFVHLEGMVKSGTAATIYTLPIGYRPTRRLIFAVQSDSALGRCDVHAGGMVQMAAGSNVWFGLNGLSFLAEQ
jgi:hypothetical protein